MRRRLIFVFLGFSILSMTTRSAAAQAAPVGAPGGVQVHIDAGGGYESPPSLARAVRTPSGDVGWERLCKAPCDRAVDPSVSYRIEGGHKDQYVTNTDADGNVTGSGWQREKFLASAPFLLSAGAPSQALRVEGSWYFWHSCRIWCTAAAAGFAPIGVLAFAGVFTDKQDHLGTNIVRYSVGIPAATCFAVFGAFAVYSFMAQTKVYDESTGRRLARTQRLQLTPNGVAF